MWWKEYTGIPNKEKWKGTKRYFPKLCDFTKK